MAVCIQTRWQCKRARLIRLLMIKHCHELKYVRETSLGNVQPPVVCTRRIIQSTDNHGRMIALFYFKMRCRQVARQHAAGRTCQATPPITSDVHHAFRSLASCVPLDARKMLSKIRPISTQPEARIRTTFF